MIGKLEVKRSARYGESPKHTIDWVDIDWKSSKNHAGDYLRMNRIILDDTLPSGDKADFQQFQRQSFPQIPIEKLIMLRELNKKQELLNFLIEFTVNCRNMQYLMDGNHRTSILLLFELLGTFDISCCKLDPIRLYVLYSNCGQDNWSERKQNILKYCTKRTRLVSHDHVTREDSEEIRRRVKHLWYWNSWFEVMSQVEQDWLTGNETELIGKNQSELYASKRANLNVYRNWKTIHKERE